MHLPSPDTGMEPMSYGTKQYRTRLGVPVMHGRTFALIFCLVVCGGCVNTNSTRSVSTSVSMDASGNLVVACTITAVPNGSASPPTQVKPQATAVAADAPKAPQKSEAKSEASSHALPLASISTAVQVQLDSAKERPAATRRRRDIAMQYTQLRRAPRRR